MALLFQAISIVLLFKNLNADLYTSLGQMTKLVETEVHVTTTLKKFIEFQTSKLDEAKELIKDFDFIAESSYQDPENFIGNPVNALLLIKKLTKDLQKIVDTMNTYSRLKDVVQDIKNKILLPTNDDYKGSIEAIHRLEDTYLLNPADIARGNLSQKHISRPLTSYECFELGRVAYENEDFYHALRWMSVAMNTWNQESPNPTSNLFDIIDYLAYSTSKQGNLNHAIQLTKKLIEIDPTHARSKRNLEYFEKELKTEINKLKGDNGAVESRPDLYELLHKVKNERPLHVLGEERDNYEALCRGENLQLTKARQRKLFCRYINYHPSLIIAPVKEEIIYDQPKIWVFHDVISDKQIEILKTLAFPKLKRAIVRSPVTGNYETANYRISQSGWLQDKEHTSLRYMTNLVSAVTNLTMKTAEEWQVANYGLGGQYEPHFDFARKAEPGGAFDASIGNRIATWLYYLESPEVGGATVFPIIGAKVTPIRRAAVFWYNLLPSGNGDSRTRHAACPVLFGTKWVSNKWIHAVGQEFRRPCGLKKENTPDF